jgi:c-di-GMP-binding flagellar brake protein YcgR
MALDAEKRQAERYRMDTTVIIRRGDGEPIPAVVADISSSGMLVRMRGSCPFQVGEDLTVEVDLADYPDMPLSHWGLAKVVRLDGDRCAMQLTAGSFYD